MTAAKCGQSGPLVFALGYFIRVTQAICSQVGRFVWGCDGTQHLLSAGERLDLERQRRVDGIVLTNIKRDIVPGPVLEIGAGWPYLRVEPGSWSFAQSGGWWKLRKRCLRVGWKSVRKGTNVNEALLLPEKNRGRTGKVTCKSVEQEENHEKGPRGSWARNHMGNPDLTLQRFSD